MDYYEQQAWLMKNQPGLTLADGEFIDRWVQSARADDRRRVTNWVRDKRSDNRDKAKDVLSRVDKLQDRLVTVRKQAERNEVPWSELAKARRRLMQERVTLEKVYESLTSSEESSTRMESDPTAYLTEFYSRFPSLADRRPNLAADLSEDQRKRGFGVK